MAINKIDAPLATSPATFATPVINQLQALAINVENMVKFSNYKIAKGSIFCVGGTLYVADSDTTISGTMEGSTSVKFTVSGSTLVPEWSTKVKTDLIWSGEYHGWYDTSNSYFMLIKAPGGYIIPGYCRFGSTDLYRTNAVYQNIYSAKVDFIGTVSVLGTFWNIIENIGVKISVNGIQKYERFLTEGTTWGVSQNVFVEYGDIITIDYKIGGTIWERIATMRELAICSNDYGMVRP